MPQLDPTWFISQLFWLVVTFVVLYQLLRRWALPRIENVLAMRKDTISSDIDRAQHVTAEADRARQDYERALADARARSQQLFADAAAAHKVKAEAAGKAMDDTIASMLKEAAKKIDAQKKNLLDALAPASNEIASMIVEKLTRQAAGGSKVKITEISKFRNR